MQESSREDESPENGVGSAHRLRRPAPLCGDLTDVH